MNLPLEARARSQDMYAHTIGLRGKASTTAVPSLMRSVLTAATASGNNASVPLSAVHNASNPTFSAAWARPLTSCKSRAANPVSSFIVFKPRES